MGMRVEHIEWELETICVIWVKG